MVSGDSLLRYCAFVWMLAHPRAEYVLSTELGRTLVPSAAGSLGSGPWVNVPPTRADFDYSYSATFQQLHESLHRMGRG